MLRFGNKILNTGIYVAILFFTHFHGLGLQMADRQVSMSLCM